MVCLIALIVFSILGIFSATHRLLAKEALDCVLRRITLRPCNTGFNEKIKGRLVGKLLNRSVLAARLFNKHFELISWLFIILSIISAFYVVKGGYNYYLYGSCNGLNQNGFCVFDPVGENNKISNLQNTSCSLEKPAENKLNLSNLDLEQFPQKSFGTKNQLVFIGCYNCDYSHKAYPLIMKLANEAKSNLIFIHIPAKTETDYISSYAYCAYQQDKEKFWTFNGQLFNSAKKDIADPQYVKILAEKNGFDGIKLQNCVTDNKTKEIIKRQFEQVQLTGVYGTPTVFINGKALVGPKPYRVYKGMIYKQ